MSREVILNKVQSYLAELYNGSGPKLEFSEMGKFGDAINRSLRRQLSPDIEREFKLRASNLGRPTCVLQAEKLGLPREQEPYSSRFRNLFGDLVEASAVAAMKKAGVNITGEQSGVAIELAGQRIEGTYDLIIAEPEPKLYDVKSASGWTFKNKYSNKNLANIWEDGDAFGYVTQAFLYSQALGIPVGGLIVINKEDGQWDVVPPPIDDTELRRKAIQRAIDNIVTIKENKPFKRCFEEVEETFRKKKTGNRILCSTCGFCSYKQSCWPTAIELEQVVSKGQSPRKYWYTHVTTSEENGKEEN